jgi:GT2 family glycosyltransferase
MLYLLLVSLLGLAVASSLSYLLLLLAAAAGTRHRRGTYEVGGGNATGSQEPGVPLRFTVVIPAHNEELVLGATLRSLREQRYPADRYEVVVIADNSTDATAAIAQAEGATVLERTDPEHRGKGYALDWAFTRLLNSHCGLRTADCGTDGRRQTEDDTRQDLAHPSVVGRRSSVVRRPQPADAFVIVDADTWVAPEFLAAMAGRLAAGQDERGCCALQGRYGVLNGSEGWRAALMAGAFDLFNHVRPLGADRLGLSAGLKGNGMAFTRPVLERARWQGRSITEDIDYGLDLLRHHGIRVGYVPDARVTAQMPTTAGQAASQRARWEGGRYRLLCEQAGPLLCAGLRCCDVRLLDAAVALMVPPLAELFAMLLLWGGLIGAGQLTRLLPAPGSWWIGFAIAAGAFGVYVVGGLRVAGAPRAVYAALARAPLYAAWKFALYAAHPFRRRAAPGAGGPSEWVRTERAPM